MKIFILLALAFSFNAFADQAVTLTCRGNSIVLEERKPYLGENSQFSQSLFILKKADTDESRDTAFFLDIEYDVGRYGMQYISGKNSAGGSFSLVTSAFKDASDGTIILQKASGQLTFHHGPLKGSEAVECELK